MPLTLDNPEVVATTIDKYEINSFAIDLDRAEILVAYDKIDSDGVNQGEAVLTIDGPDFPAAITEASAIAGADVYTALKTALYNQIIAQTGQGGAVS
jgi:hypothetical protein